MSNSVDASPARASVRSVILHSLSAGIFALAGLIFWMSFDTAKGVDIRTDDPLLRLSDRVQAKSTENQELESGLSTVRKDIEGLSHSGSGTDEATRKKLDALANAAGTYALTGGAVTVTLDDAPPNATPLVPGVPDPQPNDLVIHQQDLQAVVNALWDGGATGIQVMDQRLISTSAVRCVGNTLILQGRVYSPPYRITAVGGRDSLHKALDRDPAIQNYLQYVNAYGLGWKVEDHKKTTLPGYSGTADLRYARPVG